MGWPMPKGVDLDRYALDVRRIAAHIHARAVTRAGFEFEDFLSNLYLAILRRNAGQTPYDPKRASLSRYVGVLGRTVLNHMVTKRWRLDRKHQLGATGADGQQVDAALVAVAMAAPVVDQDLRQDAQELLSAQLVPQRVQRGALMVLLGFKTREISERIGAPREVVAWLRSELKEAAQGLK